MVPEHISFSSPVIYSKRTISFFSLFMIFLLQSGYVGLRDAEKIGYFFLSHFFAVLI